MHETEFCKQFLKVNQKHRNFVNGNQNCGFINFQVFLNLCCHVKVHLANSFINSVPRNWYDTQK